MIYDVAIVGAGPAGSMAAKLLSEKGLKVILIDKEKFPRDKPCGGGLPRRLLETYSFVNSLSIIESSSYSGTIYSPSFKEKVEIHSDLPLVGMVLRKKFDFFLVKLAVEKETFFMGSTTVVDIKIQKENVELFLDNGKTIESKIVIGADGIWSIVAKKTGLRNKKIDHAVCLVEEFKVDTNTLDMFFGNSRTSHVHSQPFHMDGYGWVFPKRENVNIGIAVFSRRKQSSNYNLLKLYKEYIQILKNNNIIPNFIEIKNVKGGAIPIVPLDKTYCDRTILIGDAAGFASAFSGEGLFYAMKSGEIATDVIVDALLKGKTSKYFLSKYQKNWKKDFGKDLRFLYKMRKRQKNLISDKIFKIVNSDERLRDLFAGVGIGALSLSKYRWKLLRRIIYASIKYKFKKRQ